MSNLKFLKILALTLLTIALLANPSSARADVAPPVNPPGSNLQPGPDNTQVRMVAETVQIDVKASEALGSARITADFTMRNLGSASENIAVRFPISANDGRGQYPEIKDLVIQVDGKPVSYQRTNYPDIRFRDSEVPWAEFNISFPPGQDIPIQVAYNLNGSGYMPFTAFYYILESGAGWKDTIGSADIILRLPYPASQQNVIMNMQIGWGETTPGGVIQGNEVRWHFENFEPEPYAQVQNMEFVLVAPSAWQNILKAREVANQNPGDSEAWGQLAKLYKGIFLMGRGYRSDPGGDELYALSIEAYEKCLSINPKDAEWHAGFADLLANRTIYTGAYEQSPDTYRALDEIHTALALAPNNTKVQEIAQNISYMFPDGIKQNGSRYDFPWLTQTPTAPAPTATIVPVLDPAALGGIYQSEMLTLANNKKAQLILTLSPDHNAVLETRYESGPPETASGSWTDNGDGSLNLLVTASNQQTTEIKFIVKQDLLQGNTYPSFFGEAGLNLQRLNPASPLPASPKATTQPPATDEPLLPATQAAQPSPLPASKPGLPFCGGSAALVGVVVLAARKRK